MTFNTHTIKDWRATGGSMVCVTTYGRESDGSLYVKDVNGLPADALAEWLTDRLLEREVNAQGQAWESRADDAYMQYQEKRWHAQWVGA